jgi:hypothetical protein
VGLSHLCFLSAALARMWDKVPFVASTVRTYVFWGLYKLIFSTFPAVVCQKMKRQFWGDARLFLLRYPKIESPLGFVSGTVEWRSQRLFWRLDLFSRGPSKRPPFLCPPQNRVLLAIFVPPFGAGWPYARQSGHFS